MLLKFPDLYHTLESVLDMKCIFFSCLKGEEPVDKEVLKSDLDQIENLLIVLQDLMCETDKSSENYQNLLLKLPIDYANEYHYLIQWSAVYVILSHNTRKSRSHVDGLKTSHFVKQIEIETNCFYYELAKVCIFNFIPDLGCRNRGAPGSLLDF